MASEVTYVGKPDLFLAAALNQALREDLMDKSDLRQLCMNRGRIDGSSSLSEEQPGVKWDDAMLEENSDEITQDYGNTDLSTSISTITVARHKLKRYVTDPYVLAGGPRPGVQAFAGKMGLSARLSFTDTLCGLATALSTSVGSTVDLSVDILMEAQYAFTSARNGGRGDFIGAPISINHFLESLRSEGGSSTFTPATEQLLSLDDSWPGYGLRGEFRGMRLWDVDSVVTNGADKENMLISRQCFGYKEGVPAEVAQHAAPGSSARVAENGAPIFVEFERDADLARTLVVGNYYYGISELEDARGVLVISSAT